MELFVRTDTDMAHPHYAVPMYLVHSIKNPFCNLPGCWCRTNALQVQSLLAKLSNGEMMLYKVGSDATKREGKPS